MRLANIWRHPIKGVSREELERVELSVGRCLPYDRHWAIAHEEADLGTEEDGWAKCSNFARAARVPQYMAVSSVFDAAREEITLSHPDQDDLVVQPDTDPGALVRWVAAISDPEKTMPVEVVSVGRGMTDSRDQTVSLHSLASIKRLSEEVGVPLDQRRFRGNFWFDGPEAYAELDWVGKMLTIGEVEIEVVEPIARCQATTVNPDTGEVDARVLRVLKETNDHYNFGVFGIVRKRGNVALGDTAQLH